MSAVLPIPHRSHPGAPLRSLRDGVLRVAGAALDLTALDDLVRRAHGFGVVADTSDPDVVLVSAAVAAPAPIGVDPRPAGRSGRSEAYGIRTADGRLVLTGASDEAFFRGLVTVAGSVTEDALPTLEVDDHPRFAWRGLSLDVVRRWFPLDEVERIIDLLALHKFTVLHLHLTDTQAWRFAVPERPDLTPGADHYTTADLDHLVAYARARHITVVPEVDMPGHVAPTVAAAGVTVAEGDHPFLRYLDWVSPGVEAFVGDVLDELTARFDAPYLHIGGDEAFGDPPESYGAFVRACANEVRARGRRTMGWQETVRAEALGADDLIQLWIADRDRFDADRVKQTTPEQFHPLVERAAALFAESVHDPAKIGAAGIPTIVSSSDPLYLDRKPAEPSLIDAQNETLQRLGNTGYDPTPSTDVLRWDPFDQTDIRDVVVVAGIEAALWCETVTSFDDAALLLLPRLALVAHRAWGSPDAAVTDVIAAARSYENTWTALGFGAFHRSTEVYGS